MTKVVPRVVLGAIGILVAAAVVLFVIGEIRWRGGYLNYSVEVQPIAIPTSEEDVQRGEHLVRTHYCEMCHGRGLAGQALVDQPALFVIYAPNLTSGEGGLGARYSDEDWIQSLRHGVGQDGRGLMGMPSRIWYHISDDDLAAMIAYLRTIEPVDNGVPERSIGPMGRVMVALGLAPASEAALIDHEAERPAPPEPGVTVEYGEYLATSSCSACHGQQFNGGMVRDPDGELVQAPNLTPGGNLAAWTTDDFANALRTGVTPEGRALSLAMPWPFVGRMTDQELQAVWMFLQSLPAREQGIERTDF